MRARHFLPWLIALAACAGGLDAPGTPAEAPAGAPAEAPAGAATATGPLPDLTKGLLAGACENGPGREGADSHFVGSVSLNGSTASGKEAWILGANALWKARGGKDCKIEWALSGAKVGVGACADCDYGLMMTATPDITGSDCPEELVKREAKPMDLRYDVKALPDGTALVFFSKSGKRLAQGYHNASGLTYASQHQCKWF